MSYTLARLPPTRGDKMTVNAWGLRLLGAFELRKEGEAIDVLGTPGAEHLLARLAIDSPTAVTRNAAAADMFPDVELSKARIKLSSHLFYLRKRLAQIGVPDMVRDGVAVVTGKNPTVTTRHRGRGGLRGSFWLGIPLPSSFSGRESGSHSPPERAFGSAIVPKPTRYGTIPAALRHRWPNRRSGRPGLALFISPLLP
jgi:hypothetical protein